MEIKDKEKEIFSKLFELSSNLKITCVKPDRCIYVMPAESCSWMAPTSFMRRLNTSNFSKEFQKLLESANLKDVEIVKT